jgi:hypothetical protein
VRPRLEATSVWKWTGGFRAKHVLTVCFSAGVHSHALEDGHEHVYEIIDAGFLWQVTIFQGSAKADRGDIERARRSLSLRRKRLEFLGRGPESSCSLRQIGSGEIARGVLKHPSVTRPRPHEFHQMNRGIPEAVRRVCSRARSGR